MRVAIRPLPTIRVGDIRWWWRRRLRWMAARISRPVGISTAAQIHTRSTVCSVCPGTRPRVIRVSREHARQGDGRLDRSDLVEELAVEPAPVHPSGREHPDDGGDVEQDHPQRWGGLVRLRHPPIGQNVATDADRTSMAIVTIVLSGSRRIRRANLLPKTRATATPAAERPSAVQAERLRRHQSRFTPRKHRPQVTGTQGCHPGFICTFSLEMRGYNSPKAVCENLIETPSWRRPGRGR